MEKFLCWSRGQQVHGGVGDGWEEEERAESTCGARESTTESQSRGAPG
jgi:hypothetical protein